MEIIENFKVVLDFQVVVNEETGEITTHCVKKSIDKTNFKTVEAKPHKSKKEESTTPQLILDTNKYLLNSAAVEFMEVNPDDRLDIKYEKINGKLTPVIGKDEVFGTKSGNRLTKSFTVAYRGSKIEELSKYGTEFTIIAHNAKDGLFILQGNKNNIEDLQEDDNISIEDIDEALSLEDLTDTQDADITEINADFFKL